MRSRPRVPSRLQGSSGGTVAGRAHPHSTPVPRRHESPFRVPRCDPRTGDECAGRTPDNPGVSPAALPNRLLVLLSALVFVGVFAALVLFERPGLGSATSSTSRSPCSRSRSGRGTEPPAAFSRPACSRLRHPQSRRADLRALHGFHADPPRYLRLDRRAPRLVRLALQDGPRRAAGARGARLAHRATEHGGFEKAIDGRLATGSRRARAGERRRLREDDGRSGTVADDALRSRGGDTSGRPSSRGRHRPHRWRRVRDSLHRHSVLEASRYANRLEQAVANARHPVTVGWAGSPAEGRNALSLYRAADERLYARRLLRTPRPGRPDSPAPLRSRRLPGGSTVSRPRVDR